MPEIPGVELGRLARPHQAVDYCHVGAGRLFAIDVLLGRDRRFEHLRVVADRRRDQHGIHILVVQHLPVILVDLGRGRRFLMMPKEIVELAYAPKTVFGSKSMIPVAAVTASRLFMVPIESPCWASHHGRIEVCLNSSYRW
jgi:hypothetical protein